MMSDMNKHPQLGMDQFLAQMGLIEAMRNNHEGMRRWITGFN